MATAKERRDIMYNVIARVGLDGDVLGEYSKAMSSLNKLKTYNELNPPQPTTPTIGQNIVNQPQTPQNDTTLPPMGEGGLNGTEMA